MLLFVHLMFYKIIIFSFDTAEIMLHLISYALYKAVLGTQEPTQPWLDTGENNLETYFCFTIVSWGS